MRYLSLTPHQSFAWMHLTARQIRLVHGVGVQAKERAAVKAGKKPFYLKKGELRKAELVEKYKVRLKHACPCFEIDPQPPVTCWRRPDDVESREPLLRQQTTARAYDSRIGPSRS